MGLRGYMVEGAETRFQRKMCVYLCIGNNQTKPQAMTMLLAVGSGEAVVGTWDLELGGHVEQRDDCRKTIEIWRGRCNLRHDAGEKPTPVPHPRQVVHY